MNRLTTFLEDTSKRRHVRMLAFILFFASLVIFVFWAMGMKGFEIKNLTKYSNHNTTNVEIHGPIASRSVPTRLFIDSINLNAKFEQALHLESDGSVAVPIGYDTVGWYQYSPTPGELGPSVILGHVDSKTRPAVFYSLGQVKVGDEVVIEREDGSMLLFLITEIERVQQDKFPSEKVYGSIPQAGLRLITCSGYFNKGEKRYSHNLIVYAELSEIKEATTTSSTPANKDAVSSET